MHPPNSRPGLSDIFLIFLSKYTQVFHLIPLRSACLYRSSSSEVKVAGTVTPKCGSIFGLGKEKRWQREKTREAEE